MREYLQSLWYLNATIKSDLQELENLRSLAMSIGSSSVEERVKGGVIENKTENCIIKIVDLEKKINEELTECLNTKNEIFAAINRQEDDTERLVLRLRYIEFLTWEQIAERMGYSVRQIYRLHKRALKNFN